LDREDLPESIKERFLKMPAIRKKRIIQDLTQSLLDHKEIIKDQDLLSRYVDLFLLADPDLIYSLVTRLMQAEAGSALEELRAGLSEDDRFIDKA
nr:ATP-binding protein [Enterococcus faecalis]